MGSTEKFCLRWNDFESNISSAFRELRDDKDFFDVTLACEDSDQLQAHKVILSACSPFFRTVLRRHRHEHPLLYLKGVKYLDLLAVLNFMYHGEVNVAQEELNSFLAVAEDLRVKGLTQNGADSGKKRQRSSPPPSQPATPTSTSATGQSSSSLQSKQSASSRHREQADRIDEGPPVPKRARSLQTVSAPVNSKLKVSNFEDDDDIQEVVPVKSEPGALVSDTQNNPASVHYVGDGSGGGAAGGQLSDPATMEYGDEYGDYEGVYDGDGTYDGSGGGLDPSLAGGADGNKDYEEVMEGHICAVISEHGVPSWQCSACSRTFKQRHHLKDHIEALHMIMKYDCPYCGKICRSKPSLRMHILNHKKSDEGV